MDSPPKNRNISSMTASLISGVMRPHRWRSFSSAQSCMRVIARLTGESISVSWLTALWCSNPYFRYLETFHDKAVRVVVTSNGVQQPATGDKASFRHAAFTDNHLPGIGSHRIRVHIEIA